MAFIAPSPSSPDINKEHEIGAREVEVHLLVLVHGMWGNPSHLSEPEPNGNEGDAQTRRVGSRELSVLVASTNREASTYDGIDWGGERIATEVQRIDEIEKDSEKKVTRFSIVGYSLGGLLSRYVIGILESRGFFKTVKPVSFTTIATPHLGLPRYPSFLSYLTTTLGPRLLSRTGEQFYGVDKWSGSKSGRSLLQVMSDERRVFMRGLKSFEKISIYANAVNDVTVPYVTAAIETFDPFVNHFKSDIDIIIDDQYAPLIKSFTPPTRSKSPRSKPRALSREWWSNLKPRRPIVPPFLQTKFPLNILIYMALPILMPTFLCLAIVRLSLDSRASRARIKLLESGAYPDSSTPASASAPTAASGEERLVTLLRTLEKEFDDAVADMMDDPSPLPPPSKSKSKAKSVVEADQPRLTPTQQSIARSLNAHLPQMKKYLAFIDPVRNSHAVIVCRDVGRFESHREGEGVLRHWADGFEL
ncbi:DUF676-domain-containing protein [Sistotremastrum niveocremeum HHB9708]|uniref:DUF676-domain-containing protein n=1 Tax=Sistotremastrum niveocremeum HHB9708 TaxID=1314777 RepID=A0A164RMZ9_9AGAM|nr:DUF676-domain-containing protein [Sistotremastrum niveocremeum HHB9708]